MLTEFTARLVRDYLKKSKACFCHELRKKRLDFERQVYLPVYYDGLGFDEGLRMDVFVEQLIVCELKAVDTVEQGIRRYCKV